MISPGKLFRDDWFTVPLDCRGFTLTRWFIATLRQVRFNYQTGNLHDINVNNSATRITWSLVPLMTLATSGYSTTRGTTTTASGSLAATTFEVTAWSAWLIVMYVLHVRYDFNSIFFKKYRCIATFSLSSSGKYHLNIIIGIFEHDSRIDFWDIRVIRVEWAIHKL